MSFLEEQFELLTRTPENAARLKELILQLAVQGKLVPQNPSDDPASVLLENIKAEKEKLIKGGKFKKQKPLPPITEDEVPYDLPDGWVWCRLGILGRIVGGGTPKTAEPKYFSDNDIAWLTPADLSGNKTKYVNKGRRDISKLGLNKSSAQLMPKGTVIFSSRAPIGYVAIAQNEISTNQGFKSCVPWILEINEYIYYYLIFEGKNIAANAKGTTFKEVSGKEVSKLIIPLPPLNEQKYIIERVESLMAKVDKLFKANADAVVQRRELGKSMLHYISNATGPQETQKYWHLIENNFEEVFTDLENVKELRKTCLQLAIQGKLVPQNPTDEPASVLLEKIKAEKKKLINEGKIKKEKPLPPIEEDEIPYELLEGWVWCRLGEITKLITKGSSPNWQGINYVKDELLFITSENVDSYKLKLVNPKYVEWRFNKIQSRSILRKGDFLMNIVGASIGRTAINNLSIPANINQAVCLIRKINESIESRFLLHFFNSVICISYMFDRQVDNARANLSMTNISKFLIPLPPLAEQKRIVEKVDKLMGLCDRLEKKIKESGHRLEVMMRVMVMG